MRRSASPATEKAPGGGERRTGIGPGRTRCGGAPRIPTASRRGRQRTELSAEATFSDQSCGRESCTRVLDPGRVHEAVELPRRSLRAVGVSARNADPFRLRADHGGRSHLISQLATRSQLNSPLRRSGVPAPVLKAHGAVHERSACAIERPLRNALRSPGAPAAGEPVCPPRLDRVQLTVYVGLRGPAAQGTGLAENCSLARLSPVRHEAARFSQPDPLPAPALVRSRIS